jgi:hypothetical protein
MKMRKLLLLAGVLGLLAVPGVAQAKTRHYFGHTTCGAGSAKCPVQHEEITMSRVGSSLRAFSTQVTCVWDDASAGTQPNTSLVLDKKIHVRRSGRFTYKRTNLTIKGRIHGKRITGSVAVNFLPNEDEEGMGDCRVKGLHFSAVYKKKPMYALGKWKGTAHCGPGFSNCPEQSQRLTMRLKKGRIVNMTAELKCAVDSGASTKTILFHLDHVAIDWYGHFRGESDYTGSDSTFSLGTGGLARGRHLSGGINYFESTDGNVHTCEASPTIAAARVGA